MMRGEELMWGRAEEERVMGERTLYFIVSLYSPEKYYFSGHDMFQ
jgi:hypothetical protein